MALDEALAIVDYNESTGFFETDAQLREQLAIAEEVIAKELAHIYH